MRSPWVAQRFTTRLCEDRRVNDDVYAEALDAFGYQGITDMIQLAGHYMTISSLLNTFEVPVPK